MKRTHARPIPSGRLPVLEATAVGGAMGVGGVGILYGLTNPMVAALVVLSLRVDYILLHNAHSPMHSSMKLATLTYVIDHVLTGCWKHFVVLGAVHVLKT